MHFSLAFPSIGGASSFIFKASPIMPIISFFDEFGIIFTDSFMPLSSLDMHYFHCQNYSYSIYSVIKSTIILVTVCIDK